MALWQRAGQVRALAFGMTALLSCALGVIVAPALPSGHSGTVQRFHKLLYDTTANPEYSRWLGVPIQKCPMDLMTYQEILFDTKPDLLVEAGTFQGGSALFFASIMDALGKGRVITIDPVNRGRPPHPRITYLRGLSTSPEIVSAVKDLVHPGEAVMVVLDSDHSLGNVLKEMRTYGPLVTLGAYMVVEDTDINGHPVLPSFGPGPAEAVAEFFKTDNGFVQDKTREKYLLTFHPGGFLKKIR